MVRLFIALLLAAACLNVSPITLAQTPNPSPQTQANSPDAQEPTVRLKTDLIEVRAVVTDHAGRPVDNLHQEDFELSEDGQLQMIRFFSLERIGEKPAEAATVAPPAKPPIPRNSNGLPTTAPTRTIVLFVDTLHLSHASLASLKEALKRFANEQISDQDLVAVKTSSGLLGLLEQFTRDRQLLRLAIDRLRPWGDAGAPTMLTPYLAAQVLKGDPEAYQTAMAIIIKEEMPDPPPGYIIARCREIVSATAYRRRVTLAALQGVANSLAPLPGQRLIAMLSEGFSAADVDGSMETRDVEPAVSAAVRAGVVIYTLSAGGLAPDDVYGGAGIASGSGSTPLYFAYASGSRADLQRGLRDIAADTGGEAFFNTNDFNGRLRKALDDNGLVYTLAYYPPEGQRDDRLRRIVVRVKGHPEYTVRAQHAYLPLARKAADVAKTPEQQMARALASPLPLNALGVTASLDYLDHDDGVQALLRVFIDGGSVEYREANRRQAIALEMAGVVLDAAGKAVDSFSDKIEADLRPERAEQAKQNGYRCTRRLRLKPGLYQARISVREPHTGRIGTAMAWVEVPDLRKVKLALSDLFLSGRQAPRTPAKQASSANHIAANAEQTPTPTNAEARAAEGEREVFFSPKVSEGVATYRNGDVLVYYVMLYAAAVQPADFVMQVTITQSGQAIYQSQWQPLAARLIHQGKKGVDVSGQLQLALKPGVYELCIKTRSQDAKQMAERTALFKVEP